SDNISDVFLDIILDTNSYQKKGWENTCIVSTISIGGVPMYKANQFLEDSLLKPKHKAILSNEIFQMDSIIIYNFFIEENGDDVFLGENFLRYVSKKNNKNKDFNISKLFMDVFFDRRIEGTWETQYTYGKMCGTAMMVPFLRQELEKRMKIYDSSNMAFQDKTDLYYFDLWLDSENKEIKVYGAEALIRLNNRGVVLDESQIKKIRRLKRSRKKIRTCAGCFIEDKRIKKILKPFSLK
ncbi:MAG: hypothetical protein ABF240_08875, partial [Flavobacteriales bacterium]